jgi:HPt (histidine-containing phosphotransfer) domain-containing protein
MEDQDLMREILSALIDDTSRQIHVLAHAIEEQDPQKCARLAHYCKGACANVGANRMAAALKRMEQTASVGNFSECSLGLSILAEEMDLLRAEAVKMTSAAA